MDPLILNVIVITVALITHHSYPSQGSFLDPQSIKDKYGNDLKGKSACKLPNVTNESINCNTNGEL